MVPVLRTHRRSFFPQSRRHSGCTEWACRPTEWACSSARPGSECLCPNDIRTARSDRYLGEFQTFQHSRNLLPLPIARFQLSLHPLLRNSQSRWRRRRFQQSNRNDSERYCHAYRHCPNSARIGARICFKTGPAESQMSRPISTPYPGGGTAGGCFAFGGTPEQVQACLCGARNSSGTWRATNGDGYNLADIHRRTNPVGLLARTDGTPPTEPAAAPGPAARPSGPALVCAVAAAAPAGTVYAANQVARTAQSPSPVPLQLPPALPVDGAGGAVQLVAVDAHAPRCVDLDSGHLRSRDGPRCPHLDHIDGVDVGKVVTAHVEIAGHVPGQQGVPCRFVTGYGNVHPYHGAGARAAAVAQV